MTPYPTLPLTHAFLVLTADVLARELDLERKPKQEPKQDAASPSQDPPHHHLQPKQGPSTPPHHQAHGPPLGPQHAQIAKHQQTSPLPERLSPAMLGGSPTRCTLPICKSK